ncbi:MAG: glycosyltransferase family 4 protein, partial [Desulfobacca sp.]|uniref:glycosyltransferase family 4 protein n=1 Tax=Desulfobacca sp. TaxID=2067990 RepID=UPI00404AE49B
VQDSLIFFRGLIHYLQLNGIEVHIISSPGELLAETAQKEKIAAFAVDMPRRIAPRQQLAAIWRLYRYIRRVKPAIVHANFPIGGLLGVIAARLAAVPIVIYGMRGLRFDTTAGLQRRILYLTERISCFLAHQVITNSFVVRERAIHLGICPKEKIITLASGSSNGVDADERFNPQRLPPEIKRNVRAEYDIPAEALVVGFVGRIVADKGIEELEQAWQILAPGWPSLYLVLVGNWESHNPVPPPVMARLTEDQRVKLVGKVSDPAPFYAAMDILVLPTRREGFPNTPLEAAAMQLPVVATNVDGCVEAVADGVTGLLVPPRDGAALAAAISTLLADPQLRQDMGRRGRERVLQDFQPRRIWQALLDNYQTLLRSR